MYHQTQNKSPSGLRGQTDKSTIPIVALLVIVLMSTVPAPSLRADPGFVWNRAVYWDGRYPTCWTGSALLRDLLVCAGYEVLDANQLKVWMEARIVDGAPSVVVFCQDIVPDTVAQSMSSACTLRRYLNAGGKVVWYADIPMYYQGHADGTRTVWDINGAISILGFNAADGPWGSETEVVFTANGTRWGLTETWQSVRPTSGYGLRVLARDAYGCAAAWVKHYVPDDDYRGFVRLFDQPGEPNFNDLLRVAEYPSVPEPITLDNQMEADDDIVGVFFYPWYENPNTSGHWQHWNGSGCSPPRTWSAHYLPDYPDSSWNPSIQLYDSKDTEVLRWQDRAMARAGVDLAIASWWGRGGYEDAGLAKAIRICKSVQWCIYYEMEAYGDPTVQKIYDDIKYVVDTFGPTRNYAKVDGKWLVLVYGAGGEEAANRWHRVKALLAKNGYHVYLNADTSNGIEPWDAVHSYCPVVDQGYTDTLPDIDDSAWIAPGFYATTEEEPRLERSLGKFVSAWNDVLTNRNHVRFLLVETWNEWHEGTQIEPGQEVLADPQGFRPKPNGDYGYAFVDAIGPAAANDLQWKSSGHRQVAPLRLEAEVMIWDNDQNVQADGLRGCRIMAPDTRIGSSVFLPDSGDMTFTARAKAEIRRTGRSSAGPELMLHVDDIEIQRWKIGSSVYNDYAITGPAPKGIHKVELAMADEPMDADWDIVVDFVDVSIVWAEHPTEEGFETGDFGVLDWVTYGDANWTVSSTESHSGAYGAQAGSIDDNETTNLSLTLDCVSGEISFYYKISSESGLDHMDLFIDATRQRRWSGEDDWTRVSFPVTAGRRTFEWVYTKDGSVSRGSDMAWVDDVVFPID